jgi:hypothetical protein
VYYKLESKYKTYNKRGHGSKSKKKCLISFESCIKQQYFPKIWRRAIMVVVAIAKPGKDPADPKNYRLISLLCKLSKIFESGDSDSHIVTY